MNNMVDNLVCMVYSIFMASALLNLDIFGFAVCVIGFFAYVEWRKNESS